MRRWIRRWRRGLWVTSSLKNGFYSNCLLAGDGWVDGGNLRCTRTRLKIREIKLRMVYHGNSTLLQNSTYSGDRYRTIIVELLISGDIILWLTVEVNLNRLRIGSDPPCIRFRQGICNGYHSPCIEIPPLDYKSAFLPLPPVRSFI